MRTSKRGPGASGPDSHVVWAAQGRPAHVRRHGSALAVAAPGLSGRDRIAVGGDADDAVRLVRDLLAELGPGYRPFGDAALIETLARRMPGLTPTAPFHWMETATFRGHAPGTFGVQWLDAAQEREAAPLFDRWFPQSYAQPGRPGVRRWAGAPGERGPLAVAGDAWSAAGCGFLAGVVTAPEARGRGLGAAVSGFVVDALVREHGRAALMVDADNTAAVAAYERIGMTKRLFRAATVAA
ncbi:GNAT family N-acetyltransferase [Streptomyces sp. NPDC001634]|uniref:GNAT family N-acetyltransferase n=1 Tax=Streptomyces sp. NPDC001634 TaxID=3154390 RepID=UPI0033259460